MRSTLVLTKGQISVHTRKILCILIVAEQKINLVRSKRRNSSPKNWRNDWSIKKKKRQQIESIQKGFKSKTWGSHKYVCLLSPLPLIHYSVPWESWARENSISWSSTRGLHGKSVGTYLWSGSGSAAAQYLDWFFWGNLDTSPTVLCACLIIQRQIGMPLKDCSERVWRGYPAETDLKINRQRDTFGRWNRKAVLASEWSCSPTKISNSRVCVSCTYFCGLSVQGNAHEHSAETS